MIIGFERTFRFFFQRYKIKASALFFGGIAIVLLGWPVTGMIIEIYGFFLLFGYVNITHTLLHSLQSICLAVDSFPSPSTFSDGCRSSAHSYSYLVFAR